MAKLPIPLRRNRTSGKHHEGYTKSKGVLLCGVRKLEPPQKAYTESNRPKKCLVALSLYATFFTL